MRWQIANITSSPKLAIIKSYPKRHKWNENSQIALSNDPVLNNTRFVFGKIAIHSEEKKEQIIVLDSSRKIGAALVTIVKLYH